MLALARFLIVFALLTFALAVFSQQPRAQSALAETQAIEGNPVKRPYIEIGDCWTYRKTTLSMKATSVGHYTLCVTYVDYSKNVISAVSSSGTDGIVGDGSDNLYTTEWNELADRNFVSASTTRFLQFPLHVGDSYSFEYEYREKDDVLRKRKKKWNMKVVGWDDVTVPAGKFRAVRIEGIGIRMDSKHRPTQLTIWYVPDVNRYVKRILVYPESSIIRELTEYRLNK